MPQGLFRSAPCSGRIKPPSRKTQVIEFFSPEVVGDGFTLGDLSGLDLELDPNGGFVNIPVIATADAEEGVLNIRDASDDLILEVVELNGPSLLP